MSVATLFSNDAKKVYDISAPDISYEVEVSVLANAIQHNIIACEPNQHIRGENGIHETEIRKDNLIMANMNQRCLKAQFKALESNSISNLDWQHFTPLNRGYHPYQIQNGKLYRSMSHYIKLQVSPRITNHIIGKTVHGSVITDMTGRIQFGPMNLQEGVH